MVSVSPTFYELDYVVTCDPIVYEVNDGVPVNPTFYELDDVASPVTPTLTK